MCMSAEAGPGLACPGKYGIPGLHKLDGSQWLEFLTLFVLVQLLFQCLWSQLLSWRDFSFCNCHLEMFFCVARTLSSIKSIKLPLSVCIAPWKMGQNTHMVKWYFVSHSAALCILWGTAQKENHFCLAWHSLSGVPTIQVIDGEGWILHNTILLQMPKSNLWRESIMLSDKEWWRNLGIFRV